MDLNPLYGKGPHGNGLRWHAEMVIAKDNVGRLLGMDIMEYSFQVRSCFVQMGLLQRVPLPLKSDQEGPDDYVATVSAMHQLLDSSWLTTAVYEYGKNHRVPLRGLFFMKWGRKWWTHLLEALFGWIEVTGNFNNVRPGTIHPSSWLWRQPQVHAHMALAAGAELSWFLHLWWCLVVATSGRKSGPNPKDTWALAWHLVNVGEQYSLFTRYASKIFLWRFRRAYPGMMSEVSWAYAEGEIR